MRIEKSLLDNYIEQTFVQESLAMKLAKEKALQFNKEGLSISSGEGALLSFLIRLSGAKKIIEIGTFTGYSGLWLLDGTQNLGQLWTFELNENYYNSAKEVFDFANLSAHVNLFLGIAKERLKEIESLGPFDAVFIDANKNSYSLYLDWAFKNLKVNGLVIADNTLLSGLVYDETIKNSLFSKGHIPKMQAFNIDLGTQIHFQSILIPTKEGLSVGIKK